MRLQAVTFAQGLCFYLEFIQREYSSYSFSRAPKQFGLFDVLNFIYGDLYALACQKVELCSTTQLSATSSLLALCQITFSQLCMLVLLLIGFPKYQKFESKSKNIYWFKSFYKSRSPLRMRGMLQQFMLPPRYKTICYQGVRMSFPLVR